MSEALRGRRRAGEAAGYRAQAQTFEEFFYREKEGLYGAVCLVTRNQHEAEELAQDAFVRR